MEKEKSLKEEIISIKEYLYIQKQRYEDKLAIPLYKKN